MKRFEKVFPWLILVLAMLFIVWIASPPGAPGKNEFDFHTFGQLPVMDRGRTKPMDTVARSYLVFLTHKQTLKDNKDNRQSAVKWLLDVLVSLPPWREGTSFDGPAAEYKTFKIDNDEVLNMLGLEPRSGLRYSLQEFRQQLGPVIALAKRASNKDVKQRTLKDVKLMEFAQQLESFQRLATYQIPFSVPPPSGKGDWHPLSDYIDAGLDVIQRDPVAIGYLRILSAYDQRDARTFNKEVRELHSYLTEQFPDKTADANFEVFFNRFEPFHHATHLYLYALILGCLSWIGWTRPLNTAALLLGFLGFLIDSWGLYGRMDILDRPPVINLYSSAVFIGWCAAGVCLIIELFFRNSFSLVVGMAVGSVTSGIIGHYLSLDGDTLVMLEAVLDTNFWLATHVTCITFGYAAMFVAGFLGIAYIIMGLFTPLLRGEPSAIVTKILYGVVCFATLLSFTGTMLGGIWADQSWGRFWGWDPKENGALLIVIWAALILHARWAGLIKQRGLAMLAVAGNIVTAWSWFGTNLLGIGLHAYGFKQGTKIALITFAISQLVIIGLAMIPMENWRSFMKQTPPPGKPSTKSRPQPAMSS
ncbi:MAG: cytochrome c biogenesis protein CcsA [Gemmataceae bacterium]|nr:cytochrome c biogenesis protein CcsA [Gemmataceae bacterium]